nr:MAG TPA: hypothetical protein [Caudoviricetes sp.]
MSTLWQTVNTKDGWGLMGSYCWKDGHGTG